MTVPELGIIFQVGFCYYEVSMFFFPSLVSQLAFTCQLKFNRNAGRLKRLTAWRKMACFSWNEGSRPSGDQPLYLCFTRVHAANGTIPQLARLEPGRVGSPSIQPVGFRNAEPSGSKEFYGDSQLERVCCCF